MLDHTHRILSSLNIRIWHSAQYGLASVCVACALYFVISQSCDWLHFIHRAINKFLHSMRQAFNPKSSATSLIFNIKQFWWWEARRYRRIAHRQAYLLGNFRIECLTIFKPFETGMISQPITIILIVDVMNNCSPLFLLIHLLLCCQLFLFMYAFLYCMGGWAMYMSLKCSSALLPF